MTFAIAARTEACWATRASTFPMNVIHRKFQQLNTTHDWATHAAEYAKLGFQGTYYLAFRDLGALFAEYQISGRALDYGCGAGRSTRFLRTLGYEVVGVDINAEMLAEAERADPSGEYDEIKSAELSFEDNSFDLVFTSFVCMELSTRDEIAAVFSEMERVVKPNGFVVNVTVPVPGTAGTWSSFSFDFPENQRVIKSGDIIKGMVRGTDVVFEDYYWSDADYRLAYERVGLVVRDVHTPMGREDDGMEWLDERTTPFVHIYILQPAE